MSARYDCADTQQRDDGLAAAVTAVADGQLVVLPTDTVYGIGADAFNPAAVNALLAAKGRGRNMPPPVLVGSVRAAAALTESLGAFGQDLIDEFWPGPLTLVFRASPTLMWDLGETLGTVAVRMPLHPVALDLLRRTGPMAVSSANRHSLPPAVTAAEAENQLGESVAVYLDGGPCADNVPSTILDLTGTVPRVLRAGALSADALRKVVPVIDLPEDQGGDPNLSPADRRAAEAIAAANAAAVPTETVIPGETPAPAEATVPAEEPATGKAAVSGKANAPRSSRARAAQAAGPAGPPQADEPATPPSPLTQPPTPAGPPAEDRSNAQGPGD